MKKKFTVGVFLALAVVLVASIVGVGGADAAKPVRTLTPDIVYTDNGDNTGTVTMDVSWDNYGAWGIRWSVGKLPNGATGTISSFDSGEIVFEDGRTTSGTEILPTQYDQPCGYDYYLTVHLLKKNGSIVRNAYDMKKAIAPDCIPD